MDAEPTLPTLPLRELIPQLPPDYNYDAGLEKALDCGNYTEIALAMGCSRRTLVRLRQQHALLDVTLARARALTLDVLADELRTLVQDNPQLHDEPQLLKTMFETGRWYLACSDPRKYGDRMNIEVTEHIDLKGAMDKATTRIITVLASQPQTDVLDQKTSASDSQPTDK